jgi:hypothetical protein
MTTNSASTSATAATIDARTVESCANHSEQRCERNTLLFAHPGRRDAPFSDAFHGVGCEAITVFHSKVVLGMSLYELARVMYTSARINADCLVTGFLYLARYEVLSHTLVTTHMMHRLYVACVQIAAKFSADYFYTNAKFATIMGISVKEMNRMELALMRTFDWYAGISPAAFTAISANSDVVYSCVALHTPGSIIDLRAQDDDVDNGSMYQPADLSASVGSEPTSPPPVAESQSPERDDLCIMAQTEKASPTVNVIELP